MNTREITASLAGLFSELVDGPPQTAAYVLNRGDVGLLRSLDKLSPAAASATHGGGASIAAHVDHIRYGLSLLNRWAKGENPWADADWGASWKRNKVDERQWADLRDRLCREIAAWQETLRRPRDVDDAELNGMIGSIVHVAYHIGAIRQIDRSIGGPADPMLT